MKNKLKNMQKSLILFILLINMFCVVACSNSEVNNNYNIADYVTVSSGGLNEYGKLEVDINTDNEKDIYKLECTPNKEDNLKNGDVVTIKCDIYVEESENYYSVITQEITYKVDNLGDCNTIAISELYDISLNYIDNKIVIDSKAKETNEMASDISLVSQAFRIDENNNKTEINLENVQTGDIVEVTAKINLTIDEFLNKYGILPSTNPIEFVVGKNNIATTYDEIDPKTIEYLKNRIEQYYEYSKGNKQYDDREYEYAGTYFGYRTSYDGTAKNVVYLIYHLHEHVTMGRIVDVYRYFKFENVGTSFDEDYYTSIEDNDMFTDLDYSHEFYNMEDVQYFVISDRWTTQYKTW